VGGGMADGPGGIGLAFQVWGQHTTWPDLEATARRIDGLGFAGLWTNDHFFPAAGAAAASPDAEPGPFLEGWITLAGFALVTRRVPLGVLVSGAGYRNVGVVVKQATAVEHLAGGGRVSLGLGAGWHPRDHAAFGFGLSSVGERLDRLEEQAAAARALLAGDAVTAAGAHVRLHAAVNLPAPLGGPIPLMIGGSGERRTLRIVARYADAWNGEGDVATWAHKNGVLDAHCAAVGRDPGSIRRTVGLPPASVRTTRRAAEEALVARLRANGLPAAEAGEIAAGSPVVGTAGEVAEALRAYAAAGAGTAIIDWPAPFDDETLDRLATLAG
jgi:alkanesulfonate monooxygenase SsuD/methylene tetrahydromethanopterin reductase-like flavin-dependent oxidoreductase (luciferase family)